MNEMWCTRYLENQDQQKLNRTHCHCFHRVIQESQPPQAGSCGGLWVLKEGLCEAGSWLAAEGRVTVRNWVATAAQYLWLGVGGRRQHSSLDEMWTGSQSASGAQHQASSRVCWGPGSHRLLQVDGFKPLHSTQPTLLQEVALCSLGEGGEMI